MQRSDMTQVADSARKGIGEASRLAGKGARTARKAVNQGAKFADQAEDEGTDYIADAQEYATEAVGKARTFFSGGLEGVVEHARKNPWLHAGIWGGAALIIGLLVGRRMMSDKD